MTLRLLHFNRTLCYCIYRISKIVNQHDILVSEDNLPEHCGNIEDKVGSKSKAFAIAHPERDTLNVQSTPEQPKVSTGTERVENET